MCENQEKRARQWERPGPERRSHERPPPSALASALAPRPRHLTPSGPPYMLAFSLSATAVSMENGTAVSSVLVVLEPVAAETASTPDSRVTS